VIAYAILNETVAIIGIFYGGRDHEQISATLNRVVDPSHQFRARR
jgi:hypothetical protein